MASDGYAAPIPTFEIEEGDGGGSTLTPNQRKAMSTRADMPSSTDSCAFDPKRLCITLTMLWAAGSISFVLSVLAVGVGAAGGEGGGTTTTTMRTTGSVCLARHHEGTQLFGEDVVEHDGHHYQVVGGHWAAVTWHQAHADAQTRCYQGVAGHLAHIGGAAENEFLVRALKANPSYERNDQAWIGATDLRSEGEYEWIGGLHRGETFWTEGGGAVEGVYTNWYPGEPNAHNGGNEDCAIMYSGEEGKWNDEPCYKPKPYFFVEFDV